jgi:DNA modification methylase
MNRYELRHGDNRAVLKTMDDNSVDSIVCDPPYELGFMGKRWDASGIAYDTTLWTECLRVLKPGGHLVAFGGTRTYHRMTVAIEDAGFEIRDSMLYWGYGTGFPKSLNVRKSGIAQGIACACDEPVLQYIHENISHQNMHRLQQNVATNNSVSGGAEQDMFEGVCSDIVEQIQEGNAIFTESSSNSDMRNVRDSIPEIAITSKEDGRTFLLEYVQREAQSGKTHNILREHEGAQTNSIIEGRKESSMEGRRDVLAQKGELQANQIRQMPAGVFGDGPQGRVHNGTPSGDGEKDRQNIDTSGSGSSHRPRSAQQSPGQLDAISRQRYTQTCGRCGKAIIPPELGTSLKPAHEPAVLARKPLTGTVADNVLTWGVGALNIDGCRVGTSKTVPGSANGKGRKSVVYSGEFGARSENHSGFNPNTGRWPANVILDEHAAEALDEQSGLVKGSGKATKLSRTRKGWMHTNAEFTAVEANAPDNYGDSGGASRFFYIAKASRAEREAGLDAPAGERACTHPTVKPIALMRHLVRLVTPKGGTVLDPFMGSGSTGCAAMMEGMRFVGIDITAEYVDIAERRIQHWLNQNPMEL